MSKVAGAPISYRSRKFGSASLAVVASLVLTLALQPQASSAVTAPEQNTPSWAASSTIYEVNVRQFSPSGNFDGVTAQLARLKTLGVGILWLMPIYPIGVPERKGTLGSPYSVADYLGINSEYGNSTDLHELIDGAHNLGMHVILDWVPNHTAWDNPWTTHKDWYLLDGSGNFQPPLGTDWSDVIQLNYANAEMRQAMIDAMKYWVTTFSVDGFREDAAGMVPTDFWEQAKTGLAETGRPLFMLAEANGHPDFLYRAFSADYNWPAMHLLEEVPSRTVGKADLFSQMYDESYSYPRGSFAMNMLTNHDENSWNNTLPNIYGKHEKALAALTFTWPGVPLIYNGQETGSNQKLQFFESDPIAWNSQSPLQTFYRHLVSLKKNNSALFAGTAGGNLTTIATGNPDVMAFSRIKGSSRVITVINLGKSKQTVSLRISNKKRLLFNFNTRKQAWLSPVSKVTLSGYSFNIFSTKL
ncbi:MAG: hypothetical protein RL196_1416 [Actinomycetota bacterium]|jgi:glycosidase